jgi:hypothetical protein
MNKNRNFTFKSAFVLLPALFSLVVSLWYQLRLFDTHIVFIFDSAHYFLASSQVLSALQSVLAGQLPRASTLITEPSFVANLMLDGPVLPLFGAFAFLAARQPALASSWPTIVVMLAMLNAVSAGAVAFVARSVTGSTKMAFTTACIFAAYPTTIASSGRFLTEPIATFLLLGLAVTCSVIVDSRSRSSLLIASLLAGLTGAMGFLLKPALIPAWAVLLILAFFCRFRDKAPILVPFITVSAAALLVLSSWLVFTKVATGQFYLMPQRQPASNVAQGHELETDGRGAMGFDSPTDKVSDSANSGAIFVKAWREHPQQISNLYLRKFTRTLGFAWNDFKQNVFGLNIEQQDFLHAIFLSFGLLGLVLMLLGLAAGEGTSVGGLGARRFFLLATPALIAIHAFLYLPFESTVRYGAPALPFLLVSAAFSWFWLLGLGLKRLALTSILILLMVTAVKTSSNTPFLLQLPLGKALLALTTLRVVALLLVFGDLIWLLNKHVSFQSLTLGQKNLVKGLTSFVFVASVVLPVCATSLFKDNQRECPIALASGDQIVRDIVLPRELDSESRSKAVSRYLIYIDCDERFANANFTFNDVSLDGKLIEANKVDSACYFVFNIMRMYASIFDLPVGNMRQWRVLQVPHELIHLGGKNRMAVVAGAAGLTVFADRFDAAEQTIRLPNKALFSASKMCNEGLALDGRVLEHQSTKLWSESAKLVGAATQPAALIYRQPRLYLLKTTVDSATLPPPDRTVESGNIPLALERFDPVLLASGDGKSLKIDRYTMQLARSMSLSTSMPVQFNSAQQVQISLKGKVCSIGRMNKVGIFVTLHGTEPNSPFMILPGCPPFIEAKSQFADFEIKDRIFLSSAPNRDYMISVGLFPGRWEQFSQYGIDRNVGSFLVKDMVLSISKPSDIDLSLGTTTLY